MKIPQPKVLRRILFVTGTRAELGLMIRTLAAIRAHPSLHLTLVATGMHLDPRAGPKLSALRSARLKPDAVVPWPVSKDSSHLAEVTGQATAALARAYRKLRADVVLIVGDRVEAFAAASAAHIARIPLAHVHGGDRAEGQVDDALRHAISQLAHLHLAASPDAVTRLTRLGQSPHTIHLVGAPGVEAITTQAAPKSDILKRYPHIKSSAVVLLHPTATSETLEHLRAHALLTSLRSAGVQQALLLAPNNDPGSPGIRRAWLNAARNPNHNAQFLPDLPRPIFLGLLRDCRLLAGNSSAGIIEAGSFATPVLNVGPRQAGRLRGPNVHDVTYEHRTITTATRKILNSPRPSPSSTKSGNPFAQPHTARTIANLLATTPLTHPAPPKLLSY